MAGKKLPGILGKETPVPLRADRFGLSVALSTPFYENRSIDLPRLVAHGRQSLADGCRSLTVFGTTGEGASLGLNERNRALGALVGAGVDPTTQLVVGIAAASVEDAIAQGRAGLMLGCPSFLLAPLAIAVHRMVLLGETTDRYALDPSSLRYLRFVGFGILVTVLWSLPNALTSLSKGSETVSTVMGVVSFVLTTWLSSDDLFRRIEYGLVASSVGALVAFALALRSRLRSGATPTTDSMMEAITDMPFEA